MNFDQIYQKILEALKAEGRGLQRFTEEQHEKLLTYFHEQVEAKNLPELEKALCIIDHTATPFQKFEPDLIAALNLELPDHLIVFALNASRKHIIQARFQRGLRLHYEFLETLKNLLHSKSPEIVEWTLRVIEESSNQGVYFLREFDKIKPPPWKWFNPHQRAVRELITLLERRWSRFERPQS